MSVFVYEIVEKPGTIVRGEIEADDVSSATAMLLARGYHIVSLSDSEQIQGEKCRLGSGIGNTVKHKDLVRHTRDLATLLRAGFPLSQAILTMRNRNAGHIWKGIWNSIRSQLEQGLPLSETMESFPKIFGPMYTSLVRAGEESGKLSEMLSRLANLGEQQDELRGRVKMAMVYPSVMLLVGVMTVFVMVAFVVPMFIGVFEETGQALPVPTQILVWVSDTTSAWWAAIVPMAGVLAWIIHRYAKSEPGRRLIGQVALHVPLMRSLVRQSQMAVFSRTLSTLLEGGVPVISALRITAATLDNVAYRQATESMMVAVRDGESLSGYMQKNPLFPAMVGSIISVGERTGDLAGALQQIAEENEKDLDREVKVFMTLLEPAMIILMGGVVGFIVLAMLLPIFSLGDAIQP